MHIHNHISQNIDSCLWIVDVTLISAQQLPIIKRSSVSFSDIIDPYVEIELVGIDMDNAKYKTKTIYDNGLNPYWNDHVSFKVRNPDFAMLRFQVFDKESITDDFVAFYAAPLVAVAEGYRYAPLYNRRGELERFSSLFLKICISMASEGDVF